MLRQGVCHLKDNVSCICTEECRELCAEGLHFELRRDKVKEMDEELRLAGKQAASPPSPSGHSSPESFHEPLGNYIDRVRESRNRGGGGRDDHRQRYSSNLHVQICQGFTHAGPAFQVEPIGQDSYESALGSRDTCCHLHSQASHNHALNLPLQSWSPRESLITWQADIVYTRGDCSLIFTQLVAFLAKMHISQTRPMLPTNYDKHCECCAWLIGICHAGTIVQMGGSDEDGEAGVLRENVTEAGIGEGAEADRHGSAGVIRPPLPGEQCPHLPQSWIIQRSTGSTEG